MFVGNFRFSTYSFHKEILRFRDSLVITIATLVGCCFWFFPPFPIVGHGGVGHQSRVIMIILSLLPVGLVAAGDPKGVLLAMLDIIEGHIQRGFA